jgi:hypothetical protein
VDPRLAGSTLLALLALGGAPRPAGAHQGGVSYAEVMIREREVEVVLQVAAEDWLPIVDLDADHDGTLSSAEARGHLRRLGASARVLVAANGAACPGEPLDVEVGPRLGRAYTALRMR